MAQRTSKDEQKASSGLTATNLSDPLTQESQDSSPVLADRSDLYYTQPSTSSAARKLATEAQQGCAECASGSRPTTIHECPICLQICIHPAILPCGHIFCFLCIKGVAYKNRRCAMCRREIPPEFLDHPQLVNGIEDIFSTKATEDGYQWFYEGRNGWWQYDDRTSQDIEEAYKREEKSCTILVAGYVYTVDLESLIQQRQNEPNRCRRVKRDLATIPKKGVAGLRIEGNTVATDSNFTSQLYQQRMNSHDEPHYPNEHTTLPTNANALISTIAATDAAVRIASDIIDSTLTHADELAHSNIELVDIAAGTTDSTHIIGENQNGISSSNNHGASETLAIALDGPASLETTVSERDQETIDLFERTFNHFRALTLRSIAHTSDDEEEIAGGSERIYPQRQMRF